MTERPDPVVQFSLVQLDDYGPWTVTPEPRPEPALQALQSRLYADLADFVGSREGYVFPGRYDNLLAVTNHVTPDEHRRFQERVRNRYPVTASVGIGTGETPIDALGAASDALQDTGSAQDADRTEQLAVARGGTPTGPITVAHFDVVDATGRYTDDEHAFDTERRIRRAALALGDELRPHGGVTAFVGGDNAISVCPALPMDTYDDVLAAVREATGVEMRVGVGTGGTAQVAGQGAKEALESGRATGEWVTTAADANADD
ncbi:GTP cyclohydrolase IIa [Haloarcula pelagica]|uniref:GTP cyclohydrolase IIa n=1 Tax=Haloarcula pelagica TaxID=3033389 RepID=UPI0024C4427D|nr:GTP cyclohydrolase IIa [Halomicroarcula sp. YJ-61-S]